MFERAIQFLKDHKEIALATCEGNLPKLRIFQIMKQEGHVLYFATSAQKAVCCARIPMLRYWHMLITFPFAAQVW